MTIRTAINVKISGAGVSELRGVRTEIEGILKLHGKRAIITLEAKTPRLSLLRPPQGLGQIVKAALAQSHEDIYTAPPVGQPFPRRTKIASDVVRQRVLRSLSKQGTQLVMTRKEFRRAFAKEHRLIRGPIAEAWLEQVYQNVFS